MKTTVKDIAKIIGAQIEGRSDIEIFGPSKIEQGAPGTITFLANPKYLPFVYTTSASAIIVPTDFDPNEPVRPTLLKVADPYTAFTMLLEMVQKRLKDKKGIEKPCFISETARIGEDPYIGAFSYIGDNATIGSNVKIYPNCYVGENAVIADNSVLYPNVIVGYACRVGRDCIIHSGTVVGSDGFGFAPQKGGGLKKIPQTGIVVIEENVEIGANCTIDRATLGETVIKKGAKIDNLVQIAHNVTVGENTVIAAQSGVSGSTNIGKSCMFGGQVGVSGHLDIADGTKLSAKSGVSKSVKKPGMVLRGSPARDIKVQLRSEAMVRQLEDMAKRIQQLEAKLIQASE